MKLDDRKHDAGKLRWSLLPWRAVREVVTVMTWAVSRKERPYREASWREVEPDRYFDALMRHVDAYRCGQYLDPESGLHYLAHAATNALFLVALLAVPEGRESLEGREP